MPFIAKNGKQFDILDQFSLSQFDRKRLDHFMKKLDSIITGLYKKLKTSYPEMKDWYGENYKKKLYIANANISGRSNNGNVFIKHRLTGKKMIANVFNFLNTRPFMIYVDSSNNELNIASVCLMKNTPNEEKICLLYVDENYRNIGIASDMLRRTHDVLPYSDAVSPFITISEITLRDSPHFAHVLSNAGYMFNKIDNPKNSKDDELYFKFSNDMPVITEVIRGLRIDDSVASPSIPKVTIIEEGFFKNKTRYYRTGEFMSR